MFLRAFGYVLHPFLRPFLYPFCIAAVKTVLFSYKSYKSKYTYRNNITISQGTCFLKSVISGFAGV